MYQYQDTLLFLYTFSHLLNQVPLRLYSTGLHFIPLHSIFRKVFGADASRDIKVMIQIPDEWNVCIQTLEGYSSLVSSVVFSRDGSRVAWGSDDQTVRVWDVETG